MNAIDIAILFILAASIIYGCYRGFVHTILSMACCILAFLVAVIFGPSLASSVSSNESIQSTLVNYTDALTRVDDTTLANQQIAGQMDDGVIGRILENVNLPDPIKNILENNLILFTANTVITMRRTKQAPMMTGRFLLSPVLFSSFDT